MGTVETQALILAAHLERQVKIFFGKDKATHLRIKNERNDKLVKLFRANLESLENHLGQWGGEEEIISYSKHWISNGLNKVENPPISIADKFRTFVKAGILSTSQYDSWDLLRNHLAHGGILSELNSGFRSGILHYFVIQVAYYRLMFAVIGFKGKYLDHTSSLTIIY